MMKIYDDDMEILQFKMDLDHAHADVRTSDPNLQTEKSKLF